MVKTNPETGPEKNSDKSPEKSASDKTKEIQADTKNKLDAVVKTDTPEGKKESEKKPEEKKPEEKKPDPKPETPKVQSLNAADNQPTDARNKPFKYARNTVIGGAAAMTALGSSISQIPLIGKIPYLPQAAAWLQSGLTSLTAPLGLGTGVNATNAFMASLPTGLGPVGAAAVGIPGALWLTGMARNFIRGDNTPKGFWGNVADATELIGQLPFMPYKFAMYGRVKAGEIGKSAWNVAKKPFVGAWNLAGNIAKGAWNTTTATASAALTPTKWGVGGAFLGTALALSTGAGAAIPITAGVGYAISNYLKNTGALDGKESGSSSKHG